MHWFYYVGRALIRLLLLVLTRWQVVGKGNIPRDGALLVVANHLSLADPPVLGVSLPRTTLFMAKEELFRGGFSRYFVRGFGAFPVSRDRVDRAALKTALDWLARGNALVMFPEGKRSPDHALQPALPGSALIAARSGATVLPVAITGTERVKGKTWWLRRPGITVVIGEPFRLDKCAAGKGGLEEMTGFMMEHIAALLPAPYRGAYKGRYDGKNRESD
ncbi:MAG: 1-acyl-sn-glycerol-3-phosphate acyltransferase [Chloroflexi bacterium]|nr:1-acyl-sn-glycerol-3-phosphate acyltransferase [Chloroflexota bacterium]